MFHHTQGVHVEGLPQRDHLRSCLVVLRHVLLRTDFAAVYTKSKVQVLAFVFSAVNAAFVVFVVEHGLLHEALLGFGLLGHCRHVHVSRGSSEVHF